MDAAITVMDQAFPADRPSIMESLFQSIENELSIHGPRHPPADNPPGEGINNKSNVDKA